MDGSEELAKLAELLRLGAQAGRQIALVRPRDEVEIKRLAAKAEEIADELDAIASRGSDPKLTQTDLPN